MRDLEGRRIQLIGGSNSHVLVLGRSGMGKTFFCYRFMEKLYSEGKRLLVLDYSGSYALQEIKKADFQAPVRFFPVSEKPFFWQIDVKNRDAFCRIISEALCELLGVRQSYRQKTLLQKMVVKHMESNTNINLREFYEMLEARWEELQSESDDDPSVIEKQERQDLERLITRLEPYAAVEKLFVCMKNGENAIERRRQKEGEICIIQLSDFSERIRRFLAEFLSMLYWFQVKQSGKSKFDYIVFDEFQNLSLCDTRAIYNMLREGRKFGVSLILSSQYISHYDMQERMALEQVDTYLLFQPAVHDIRFYLEVLQVFDIKAWTKVLQNLHQGQAVLKGTYTYEGKNMKYRTPIVVGIEHKCEKS